MYSFIRQLKIRVKLLLAFGSIIVLSVVLTIFALSSITNILEFKSLNEELDKLTLNLERIELAAKEFIYEGYKSKHFQGAGKSESVEKFRSGVFEANESLQHLLQSELLKDENLRGKIQELQSSKTITNTFNRAESLLKKRGFKDFGLEGSLRKAIHDIEKSNHTYDKVMMLTLRRHEKDFFLRKDLKYQDEFNKTATAFNEQLQLTNNLELIQLLQNYQQEFNQVVEIEKQIGLTDEEGTKGQLFKELKAARTKSQDVQQEIKAANEEEIEQARTFLWITFLIQLGLATVLAIFYANVITAVIKEIRETMRKLAEGTFPKPLIVRTTEEIGQTKIAINQFLERLQSATTFAEKLGAGELKATYNERFNNDVLAKAIISMQEKLRITEVVQSKINWTNEGAARFNDVLKNEHESMATLADKILKHVVEYLGANQGALYLIDKEEGCLERVGTYAYGKKKFFDEKLPLENGLLGQCALEGETIYLKEIPTDYVKITSGLGEATPANVLIVPLKIREEINGVLELASFELLQKHQIEFVEKMAESIASVIAGRRVAQQTKKLLTEAQKREQELAQREEEMRQNAEELQATQEEMQRQRLELEREIRQLKSKLELHEVELN